MNPSGGGTLPLTPFMFLLLTSSSRRVLQMWRRLQGMILPSPSMKFIFALFLLLVSPVTATVTQGTPSFCTACGASFKRQSVMARQSPDGQCPKCGVGYKVQRRFRSFCPLRFSFFAFFSFVLSPWSKMESEIK